MSLQIGIVGLPNVGKSTLFKSLTQKPINIANYPFCTIDPNVGVVTVPDERLEVLSRISASKRIVPTTIEFVDIAGLVKGASQGEGLGNKFLANIREVDAIAHVVRDFHEGDIIHVSGKVDPASDIEVVNLELILSDTETVVNHYNKLKSQTKSGGNKDALRELELITRLKDTLEQGKMLNTLSFDDPEEEKLIRGLNLLTTKPTIYIVNIDDTQLNKREEIVTKFRAVVGDRWPILPIPLKIEAELADLNTEERKTYLAEWGINESGLDQIIRAGYNILDLITFLTSGEPETRAWTVRKGSTAPQAAGKIHTDFEKGFIVAETISYNDFVKNNGWSGAREHGVLRIEGKTYIVQDGDVMLFRFNP